MSGQILPCIECGAQYCEDCYDGIFCTHAEDMCPTCSRETAATCRQCRDDDDHTARREDEMLRGLGA